ncbi:unnamed protein product [Mortierella alpina]
MSSTSTGSRPPRREGSSETDCTLTDTLISSLSEQALRDILRSLVYLPPVRCAIEAYASSCQTPSPSQSTPQQRPIKKRILQPAFFSPSPAHHTHLSSADDLPLVHSLEEAHHQGPVQDQVQTETYTNAELHTGKTSPELRKAQDDLKRLLTVVRQVNVFYSHTLHAPDSVVTLLNVANHAVDPQSIPILSAASLSSALHNHAETRSNRNPRKRSHHENERSDARPRCSARGSLATSSSSLPTPSASPSFAVAEARFMPPRYGDLIVDPSNTHASLTQQTPASPCSTILPQEYLELLADRILSSLVMMLIEHPRTKYQPSKSKPGVPKCDGSISVEETGDDCDLSDALLEMVYTLLEQNLYRERPLAKQLSDFLVRIALDRERRFQSRQQHQQQQQPQQQH